MSCSGQPPSATSSSSTRRSHEYGERVYVSIDGRDGKLATSGWTEQTEIPVESVFERMWARGVRRFVYSSIDRDGTMTGPDLDGCQADRGLGARQLRLLGWGLHAG